MCACTHVQDYVQVYVCVHVCVQEYVYVCKPEVDLGSHVVSILVWGHRARG